MSYLTSAKPIHNLKVAPRHLIEAVLTWIVFSFQAAHVPSAPVRQFLHEHAEAFMTICPGIIQTVHYEIFIDNTVTASLLCLPVLVEQNEDMMWIDQRHGRAGTL